MPILANVLLKKSADKITFIASDVDIEIETTATIGAGSDDAQTTVSAKKFLDILKALPVKEGQDISVSLSSGKALINAGKSRFTLQTLAADDFPTVKQPESYLTTFELPQKVLRYLFQMVHFAIAHQDIRYYLNGLLLATEGSTVRVVATDGHRLAYCETEIDGATLSTQEVIIPRKSVLELLRLMSDTDDPVTIELASNQIKFSFGSIQMLSKLVEGKFPDFQRVLPKGYENQLEVNRELLVGSLARASILASDKFKGIRMSMSDSGLQVQITNTDQEEAVEEIEANYYGDPIEIGFNVTYLQDVLNNIKTEKVLIAFGDTNSSALLTTEDTPGFKYVVMPMRI